MDVMVLIGRILVAQAFISSGLMGHILARRRLSEYAASMGVPAAEVVVAASGLLIVVGGLMVLLGIFGDLGALLLALFLIPSSLLMHPFWRIDDPQQKVMQQTQFTKNMGLLGAALLAFVLFTYTGDTLGLTVTGPLFEP